VAESHNRKNGKQATKYLQGAAGKIVKKFLKGAFSSFLIDIYSVKRDERGETR